MKKSPDITQQITTQTETERAVFKSKSKYVLMASNNIPIAINKSFRILKTG